MTKRAMVLGTNAGQADLIRTLKRMGWHVTGCSRDRGEPGQALCDHFELIDVADLDALEHFERSNPVDLVYSISSDVAIRSATALAERLSLPHFFDSPTIELLDNKPALRRHLRARNQDAVRFIELNDGLEGLESWNDYPCVVKPTDAQGQRGVTKVHQPQFLRDAVIDAQRFSRSKRAILEEFLDGIEASCNVLVDGGRVILGILSERLVHQEVGFGIPAGHLIPPTHISESEQRSCMNLVNDTVSALSIERGVLYFQMIVTAEGPRLVELAPRLAGCHMWRLIKAAYEIDLIEFVVNALVSSEPIEVSGMRKELTSRYKLGFHQCPPDREFCLSDYLVPHDVCFNEFRYKEGELVRQINGQLEVVGYYVRTVQ